MIISRSIYVAANVLPCFKTANPAPKFIFSSHANLKKIISNVIKFTHFLVNLLSRATITIIRFPFFIPPNEIPCACVQSILVLSPRQPLSCFLSTWICPSSPTNFYGERRAWALGRRFPAVALLPVMTSPHLSHMWKVSFAQGPIIQTLGTCLERSDKAVHINWFISGKINSNWTFC